MPVFIVFQLQNHLQTKLLIQTRYYCDTHSILAKFWPASEKEHFSWSKLTKSEHLEEVSQKGAHKVNIIMLAQLTVHNTLKTQKFC